MLCWWSCPAIKWIEADCGTGVSPADSLGFVLFSFPKRRRRDCNWRRLRLGGLYWEARRAAWLPPRRRQRSPGAMHQQNKKSRSLPAAAGDGSRIPSGRRRTSSIGLICGETILSARVRSYPRNSLFPVEPYSYNESPSRKVRYGCAFHSPVYRKQCVPPVPLRSQITYSAGIERSRGFRAVAEKGKNEDSLHRWNRSHCPGHCRFGLRWHPL